MLSDLFNFRFNKEESNVLKSLRKVQDNFNEKICNNPILGVHKFKEALIMGGAVRDLWLNNYDKIKDVDIFININLDEVKSTVKSYDEYMVDSLKSLCKKNNINFGTNNSSLCQEEELYLNIIKFILEENFEKVEIVSAKAEGFSSSNLNYSYSDLESVLGIFRITDSKLPYPLDAIFITGDLLEFMDNVFDFSINKISLNKKGTIKPHDDFVHTIKNNTIRYCPFEFTTTKEIIDYQFTIRLDKLLEKYPKFQFELSPDYYDSDVVMNAYLKFEEIQQLKKDRKAVFSCIDEINVEQKSNKNRKKI